MLGMTSFGITILLCAVAFLYGYLFAYREFDGRADKVTKGFKILVAFKYTERVLLMCIVAQLIIYLSRDF